MAWDVTSDVQNYLGGTATNWGWRIIDQNEGTPEGSKEAVTKYGTREAGESAMYPKLTVSFVQ